MSTSLSHQELGEKLNLFMIHKSSAGSIFFLPHGARIWRTLEQYFQKEYIKRGFDEVITPQLGNVSLWKQSGHWDHYAKNMFSIQVGDDEKTEKSDEDELDDCHFCLKPMSCPFHCLMFGHTLRSYRDLPIRFADFASLHRNEASGALRGLTRLRKFSQDDAHIFCRPDQIIDEISNCLNFLKCAYKKFGFDYELTLSTRPDKFMGDLDLWNQAEKDLVTALVTQGLHYTINDKDGAFYGPKIDVMVCDAQKRKHQCGTIQLDFQLPERFDLTYTDTSATKVRPVIIHRAILGSIERMMGILIEHYQGKFPFWLSPRQICILPLSDKPEIMSYCEKVKTLILENCPEVKYLDIDNSANTLQYKIRNSELLHYNYVIIIGVHEVDNNKVRFRLQEHETLHQDVKYEKLVDHLNKDIKELEYKKPVELTNDVDEALEAMKEMSQMFVQ